MSSTAAESEAPSDAELISRVRAGDVAAYGVLFERHRDAAKRMARQLVRGPDVDDLISEAFTKVLVVLQRGSGPDVAFRAYLLTSIRRLHVDRARAGQRVQVTDDLDTLDQDVEFKDPATASFERGAASQAFRSLPERWQLVLWHLEVEGQKPAEIAPLLGMTANSVAALAYRAREGLRQAYLQSHLADTAEDTCRWTTEHLGAYVRGGLAKRDSAKVSGHIEECRRCTAVYLELTEVNSNLAGLLGPAILGAAAPGYLAAAGGTKLWLLLLTPWTKLKEAGAAVQTGTAAAAVTAVVAVAAVAGVFGGGDEASESAEQPAQSQPAPDSNDSPPDDSPPDDSAPDSQPPEDTPPDDPPDEQEPPPQDEPEQEPPPEDDPPETAPDPPTQFDGDVNDSGVVTLRWSPVPDVRGYQVYRSSSAAAAARASAAAATVPASWSASSAVEPIASVKPAAQGKVVSGGVIRRTSYRDRSLVDGQRYRYLVTAVDRDGRESPVSKPVTVTYDPAPGVPSQLRADERERGISLRWDANDEPDLDGYRVLRDGRPVGGLTSRNRLVDGTVTDGRSYEYEVVAVDRGGQESDPASPVDATYDPAPAAPDGVRSSVRADAVALRWDANTEPDLRTYHVYRDGRHLETTRKPRLVDDSVVDGESYEYAVVAVDRDGQESSRSATKRATYDPEPTAPRGLEASVGDGEIRLSWRANTEPDLDEYVIRRDGDDVATVDGTSYTDKDVEDGTTYRYQVVALDGSDQESEPSDAVREAWDPSPAAPVGLEATERDDDIALRWKANDEPDIRSYRVYRGGEHVDTVDEPAYDDTDVTDGDTYRYTVLAVDRSGQESELSETVEESYDPAPAAPTGLKAEVRDAEIVLSWQANPEPDLREYVIRRDDEKIGTVKPSEPFTFSDAGVEDGTDYEYQVVARDASGQKASSAIVTASWNPVPEAPTHVDAAVGDREIRLTWAPNNEPDLDHYVITRNGEYHDRVDATASPSYTDATVVDGTTYHYQVTAVDHSDQESEPSETVRESWDPRPAAPADLDAAVGDREIRLTWAPNNEPDLDHYVITRNGEYHDRVDATASPSYTDATVVDGTTYHYQVTAVDHSDQESEPSDDRIGEYDPRPATPNRLRSTEARAGIALSWAPNEEPDLAGYVVLRDGRALSRTVRRPAYVDRTARAGVTYQYRVVARDGSGQRSAPSAAATALWNAPSTPTGLDWKLDDPFLYFSWNDNPEADIAYYRSWLDGEFLGRTHAPRSNDDGHTGTATHTLRVVAVDDAGNASEPEFLTFDHPDDEQLRPLRLDVDSGRVHRDSGRDSDDSRRPEDRDHPVRPDRPDRKQRMQGFQLQ